MSLRKGCPQRRLRGDVPNVRLSSGSVCLSPAPGVTHGEGGGGLGCPCASICPQVLSICPQQRAAPKCGWAVPCVRLSPVFICPLCP